MRYCAARFSHGLNRWIVLPLFVALVFAPWTPAIAISYTSSWSGFFFAFESQLVSVEKVAPAPEIVMISDIVEPAPRPLPLLTVSGGAEPVPTPLPLLNVSEGEAAVTVYCSLPESINEVKISDPEEFLASSDNADRSELWNDVGDTGEKLAFVPEPVPEPGTMLLVGLGLIALAGVRLKFKR